MSQLYQNGYKKIILGFIATLIVLLFSAYKFFPTPFERIKMAYKASTSISTIDKSATESTAVRILIWQQAVEIIKHNFVFGVTPGDANSTLLKAYEKEGLTGALHEKLNAHNQFLQTFLGTGIVGFLFLIVLTLGSMVYGFIKQNILLSLLGLLVFLNFLVESMLQTQAGTIFFTFFYCLLIKYNFHKMSQTS